MIVTDTYLYSAKSTTFGIEWRHPLTTKENAFERAQWFVGEWAKIGVEATARVFYRDGSPVADFSASVFSGRVDHAQIVINELKAFRATL